MANRAGAHSFDLAIKEARQMANSHGAHLQKQLL
jgi:hypothetical protein